MGAWADRWTKKRRVAFVSVDRDQQDAQQFWSAVLDAVRSPAPSIDAQPQPAPTAALDSDQLIETVLSEFAEQAEPVVLVIDDLHELRSTEAINQLEDLLANLPSSARVVLSSRRDLPIRLHELRLADEIAEIRAGDLRFTERETRELLAESGITLSDAGAAALYQRTEGWAAGRRLAVISLSGHPYPECFVAEFSGGVDRSSVRVDECDARRAAVDVEIDELTRVRRQRALEIIAEQVGNLPALDLGRPSGPTP